MNVFAKINGELLFVQVVKGAWMTSLETRDGYVIEPSITNVQYKNGLFSYTRLGGYTGAPKQDITLEARPAI